MKWFKKKGLWFSVGFEVIVGVLGLVAGILAIVGFLAHAIGTVAVIAVALIIAAGGDISV
jgi:hypothetical protein